MYIESFIDEKTLNDINFERGIFDYEKKKKNIRNHLTHNYNRYKKNMKNNIIIMILIGKIKLKKLFLLLKDLLIY